LIYGTTIGLLLMSVLNNCKRKALRRVWNLTRICQWLYTELFSV